MSEIDTGDSVKHGPTGETWVVAYVDGDRLAWCGWPKGEAALADCTLVEKASPEARDKLLHDMAEMRLDPDEYDRRRSMARARLGL
jgi:hypothetical protein